MLRVARTVAVFAALGVPVGTACSAFGTSAGDSATDAGVSDGGSSDGGTGRRIYVFGGAAGASARTPVKNAYVSIVDADGNLGSWTELPALEDERFGAAHAQLGDDVFVFGGTVPTAAYASTGERAALPASGADSRALWNPTAFMVTGRSAAASVVRGTNIYVGGGKNDAGTLANVERFDTDGGMWSGAGPLATGVAGHAMLLRNDMLYVLGGDEGPTAGGPTSAIRRAKFNDDGSVAMFENAGNLEISLAYHSIALVEPWIFTIGGSTGTSVVADVWRASFDATDPFMSWAPMDALPLPEGRTGLVEACTVVIERTIYVMGGRDVAAEPAKREIYIGRVDDKGVIAWTPSPIPMPEPRAAFGCAVSPSSAP